MIVFQPSPVPLLKRKILFFTEELNYLKVVSKGDRWHFAEVIQNAHKIHLAIQKSPKNLILLDYRETYFHLPQNETFNLVKVFEVQLNSFKEVKIAVIVSNRSKEIGSFWSSVCRSKGFECNVYSEMEEGENWLMGKSLFY